MTLKPGDAVEVFGLTSETGLQLNGQAGRVIRYIEEKDRFEVHLANGASSETEFVNLRPQNLRVIHTKPSSSVGKTEPTESDGVPVGKSGKPLSLRAAVKACDAQAVAFALRKLGDNAEAALDATDGSGRTLLHVCAASSLKQDTARVLALLIEHRARVDAADSEGRVPLGLAVSAALSSDALCLDPVRVLIDAKAAPNAVEEWRSPGSELARAATSPVGGALCQLLQDSGADLSWHDRGAATFDQESSREAETEGVAFDASFECRDPGTLLAAVEECDVEATRSALAMLGEHVEAKLVECDDLGRTALHTCAQKGAADGAADVARLLIENSAHVDARDSAGQPPLAMAVVAGLASCGTDHRPALDTVRVLLASSASVQVKDWGEVGCALERNASTSQGQALCRLLEAFGADASCWSSRAADTASDPAAATVPAAGTAAADGISGPEEDVASLVARCSEHGVPLERLGASVACAVVAECERWQTMSVKELRLLCGSQGLATEGCVEKGEIIAKLKEERIRTEARKDTADPGAARRRAAAAETLDAEPTANAQHHAEDSADDMPGHEDPEEVEVKLPEDDDELSSAMLDAVARHDVAFVSAALDRIRGRGDEALAEDFVRAFDVDGNTMLHQCANGPPEGCPAAPREAGEKIIALIVAAKADVNEANLLGETPLIAAARSNCPATLGIARVLLEAGADPGAVDALEGETALMEAASTGDEDLCLLLLEGKADPTQENSNGESARDLAMKSDHGPIVNLLDEGARAVEEGVDFEDVDWKSIFAKCSPTASLRAAVDACDADGVESQLASLGSDAEAALTTCDGRGRTLLHRCASSAACEGAADVTRLLIEHSAQLDARDSSGKAPLALAVSASLAAQDTCSEALDTVRVLLAQGSAAEFADEWGSPKSELARAATTPAGQEVCKLLVAFGAELPWLGARPGGSSSSPLDSLQSRCAEHGVPLEALGEAGATRVLSECERWGTMSVKQVRVECKAQGLPTDGCVEKGEIVLRLRQACIWRALPVPALRSECKERGVPCPAGSASEDDFYDVLLVHVFGGANRSDRIKSQCEAKGISFARLESLEKAGEMLKQVERLEAGSVSDLKKEFKQWNMTLEVGMEKQDMISRLKEVAMWEAMPIPELQKLCQDRKFDTTGVRSDLVRRLASGVNSASSAPESSRFKNFFSYGNEPSKEKEKEKEQQKPPPQQGRTFNIPGKGGGGPTLEEQEFNRMWEARAEENRRQFASGNRNHAGMPGGQRRAGGPIPANFRVGGSGRTFEGGWGQKGPPPARAPQQPSMDKYFRILGLPTTSTYAEVKKAYRKLALQYHPDKNPGKMKEEAEKRFREVSEAYEKVSEHLTQKGKDKADV